MRDRRPHTCRSPRHGAAATEMALLLPLLTLILVAAADFAQVLRYATVVTNCARNGALYASSSTAHSTDTAGIETAAKLDAGSLGVNVASSRGSVTNGTDTYDYVDVTVTYNVSLYCSYFFGLGADLTGIEDPFPLTRTIRMRVINK